MDTTKATIDDLFEQERFETEEGVWLPITLYNKLLGEIKIINTTMSDEYGRFLRALIKKTRIRKKIKPGQELSDEDYIEIGREALLSKGILDFRGFMQKDGTEFASRDESGQLHRENLKRLLTSQTVLQQVRKAIEDQETFNRERLEDIEKN
jgi:hypothetical protein